MSQATIWGVPSAAPCPPDTYAARDNAAFNAILSSHSGTSIPSYAVAGTIWVDTNTPSTSINTLYYYDGSESIAIGYIDVTNNKFYPYAQIGVQGEYKNLLIKNGSTADEQVDVDADWINLENSTGVQLRASSVNLTVSNIVAGANGLASDETLTASTWYYIWVYSDGATTAGLLSSKYTNASPPTFPVTDPYKACVGAMYADGDKDWTVLVQIDNKVAYGETVVGNDLSTMGAWTAVTLTIPLIARRIAGYFYLNANIGPARLGYGSTGLGSIGLYGTGNCGYFDLPFNPAAPNTSLYYLITDSGTPDPTLDIVLTGWEY